MTHVTHSQVRPHARAHGVICAASVTSVTPPTTPSAQHPYYLHCCCSPACDASVSEQTSSRPNVSQAERDRLDDGGLLLDTRPAGDEEGEDA